MTLPRPTTLVTGATSGVGLETARALAREGGSVLVHARNEAKGRPVVERLRRETGNQAVELVTADFGELAQVRALADRVAGRAPELDALVNNAGLVKDERVVTGDGFELTLQVNHLAPFLLTLRLLAPLRAAGGRVVNVSSGAHRGASLDAGNAGARLRGEGSYKGMRAYADSKLANILFTRELARREAGTGVTALAVHPGVLSTGIWDRNRSLLYRLVRLFTPLMGDPERGARAVRAALEAPASASGGYLDRGEPAEPELPADPEAAARALWEESARAVGADGAG